MAKYKRILLKFSGEALGGDTNETFDLNVFENLTNVLKELVKENVSVGIVTGGGNIWRGKISNDADMERERSHYMGMVSTVINSVALNEYFNHHGLKSEVVSALAVEHVVEKKDTKTILSYLDSGKVVIFGGGTGRPFFTTDTCAAERALEIKADCLLMAKSGVEGVYSSDPNVDKNAKFYPHLTFKKAIDEKLQVMDLDALKICNDNNISIHVFNGKDMNNIVKIIKGEVIGTVIEREE